MESETKIVAKSINELIGSSLRRTFGRNGNPIEVGYVDGLITAYFLTGELDSDGFTWLDLSKIFRASLPVAGCDLELDGFPVMCPICGHRGVRSDMEARQVSPITIRGRCPTCGFIHAYEIGCGDSCKI